MADASLNADRFLSRLKRLHAQWIKGELFHIKRGNKAWKGVMLNCLCSLLRRAAPWLGRRCQFARGIRKGAGHDVPENIKFGSPFFI